MRKFKKGCGIMYKNLKTEEEGFTIIEVVLVLAIAALIFLIVFLALPQLQRSRRDTQRKNDVGQIISRLEQSASNNSGQYPASNAAGWTTFNTTYLGGLNDPTTGNPYPQPTFGAGNAPGVAGQLRYLRNGRCGANGAIVAGGGDREVAISMGLEQGAYCEDNQ